MVESLGVFIIFRDLMSLEKDVIPVHALSALSDPSCAHTYYFRTMFSKPIEHPRFPC